MKRLISCGLAPNLRLIDVAASIRSLFRVAELQQGDWLNFTGLHLKKLFQSPNVFLFMRAREGEYMLLKSLNVSKGDEVIVQAFTCAAVVQPILWTGAVPIYADISEKTLSMDYSEFERKVTPKTKVVILQSTFGITPEFVKIKKLAREKGIFLLLDLAHIFDPEEYLKMNADGYLFSFGRDKAISSVTGGALIVQDSFLSSKILEEYELLPFPEPHEIVRYLLHPAITYLIYALFYIHPFLGKAATKMYRASKIVPSPVGNELRLGNDSIQKYPNALARLIFMQLNSVEDFNKKRIEWVGMYKKNYLVGVNLRKDSPLLRVPYFSVKRDQILNFAKKDRIYLGNWYSNCIDPKSIPLKDLKYKSHSCPVAERVAKQIINLPTNPTLNKKDINRVIKSIKKYESQIS